ncbi:hypothetical protein [Aquaspirillum serpens]|uniref:hypothetical protein n=1 Tax=Aquaspirillum serpens TaxID=190 RepID=UPI0003B55874|nr:hypothetical protein [Aquaspirillum serpens]
MLQRSDTSAGEGCAQAQMASYARIEAQRQAQSQGRWQKICCWWRQWAGKTTPRHHVARQ